MEEKITLLKVEHLVKEYQIQNQFGKKQSVHAVSDVSFDLKEGETFALVGESGCGKSTIGRLLMRLLDATDGKLIYQGMDITHWNAKQMKGIHKEIQMIFQDPYASLNPRKNVFQIISEPLITYKKYASKEELKKEVLGLMKQVGIGEESLHRYPHQFSGGQRQRIGIARAIALHPKLVICDEPVSALDVSVQAQVVNLLKDLQKSYGLTYFFISHDLSVVNYIADRVCVMFLGKVCEIADTDDLFADPIHPYTKFLIQSIPQLDPRERVDQKQLLQGEIPSPVDPPSGCRFHTRCPYATERCKTEEPELRQVDGHLVACHCAGEIK